MDSKTVLGGVDDLGRSNIVREGGAVGWINKTTNNSKLKTKHKMNADKGR